MRGEKVMNKIRKIMPLILLAIVSVMLISCGNQEDGSADPDTAFIRFTTAVFLLTVQSNKILPHTLIKSNILFKLFLCIPKNIFVFGVDI